MSELKDRLKELRKYLGLTQQEFADRLGTNRNTFAQYETGRNEPTGAVYALIYREFGVSEEWLRNGEGEMLRRDTEEGRYLKALLDDALASRDEKFRLALLEAILRLDTQQLLAVKEYAERYILPSLGSTVADAEDETPTATPAADAEDINVPGKTGENPRYATGADADIERMVADYRAQLVAEREVGAGSGASPAPSSKGEALPA